MHASRRLKTLFIGALLTLAALTGVLLIQGVGIRSTEKVYVTFVWHLHQPVLRTNLDSIDLCYEMIPKIYLNHTSVKATINLQGMLIEQLAEIRPSVLDLYRNLSDTGQIELLASGHYHPILPLLPDILREKQIAKQIATVEKYFNVTPKGIWFPECGFSMNLIPLLNKYSLKYGVIEQEGLTGVTGVRQIQPHNITYGGGFTVFPRDHPISGTVAFGSTDPEQRATDVINQILIRNQSLVSAGLNNSIIVIAGDGEVVGEHWLGGIQFLESLLTKLEQVTNKTNIETITLHEYYDKFGPYGTRDYIPPSTWASGPPNNFDWWNGTIVDLHSQDRDNHAMNEIIEAEGLGENLTTAWEYLMASEESGTRYQGLGSLEASSGQRGMIYTHIIMAEGEAEQFTDGLNITEAPSRVKAYQKVVILENAYLKVYIAPYRGGRIIELDSKATNSNLVNTYQYSQTVSQDYRNALTDGLYELGSTDLAFKSYDYEINSTADSVSLKLNYTISSGLYSGLQIQKTLTLRSNSPNLEIYFNLTNTAEGNLTFHFTNEWCLTPGGYLDGEDKINFREGSDVWQTTGMQPEDIYGEFPWVEVEDQDLTHWWEAQRSNKQEYALIRLDGQVNQLHVEMPQDTYPGHVVKLIYKATTLKPSESHTIMQNFTTGLGNHTVFDPTPARRRGAVTTVELDGDLSDWSDLDYVFLYDPEDNTEAITDILNVTITNDAYYLYIGLILRGNIEATLGNDNRSIGIATSGGSKASGKPPLTYTMWPNTTIGTDDLGFGARLSFPWWNKGRQNICRWFSTTSGWWAEGGFDRNYGDMGYQLIGMKNNTMEIAVPLYDDGLMCKSTYETINLTISAARGVSGAPAEEWFDLDVVPEQPGFISYTLLPLVARAMNVTPTLPVLQGPINSTTLQIKELTGETVLNVTVDVKGEVSSWFTVEPSTLTVPANATENVTLTVEVPAGLAEGTYYGAIIVSEEEGTYVEILCRVIVTADAITIIIPEFDAYGIILTLMVSVCTAIAASKIARRHSKRINKWKIKSDA